MVKTATLRTLRVEYAEHVVVTLNRPEVRNAINLAMAEELHEVCSELESDPRVLMIVGEGSAFAAGADLHEMSLRGREDALKGLNSGLFERIAALPLPTLAAVNGPAIGGGAELAYACDLRVASKNARFANPEVSLGIMPAAGACWRLVDLIGPTMANEVLFAGRTLSAEEALALGLVNRVVKPENLISTARSLMEQISGGTEMALRLTKLALAAPRAAHPRFDDVAQAVLFETPEKRARMRAFLDERK